MIMITLKESILADFEDTLAVTDNDVNDSLNGYIPTVNDFETNPYYRKMHVVSWYCPRLLDVYRSKYPEFLKDRTTIQLSIDTGYSRVVQCNMYFTKEPKPMTLKTYVPGWNDGFVGANLRVYKRMAISIITKIANDHSKLEEILKYAKQYKAEMSRWSHDDNYVIDLTQKSLLDL